jgi:site-specific recombinase XerD
MAKSTALVAPATAALPALANLPEGRASHYAEAGLLGAPNTQKAYASDFRQFMAFCQAAEVPASPATPETLAAYLAHLADLGRKHATIQRHLASISKLHQLAGLPSPATPMVNNVLDGIARLNSTRQKQAPAFSVETLRTFIRALDLTKLADLRLRALLLLGFTGAFRRSELSALNIEDLEFTHQALKLRLHQSKSNQYGELEEKAVFYSPNPLFCPVRAAKDWLEALAPRITGPLFVRLNRSGELRLIRLSDHRINVLVQEAFGPTFTAHSLRASFITQAVRNGQSNKAIKNQTKQKTDAMIERYARLNDVVEFNAAQNLGL